MKKLSYFLIATFSVGIISCSSDDKNNVSNNVEYTQLTTTKSKGDTYEISTKVVPYSSDVEKKLLLEQLSTEYISYLYLDNDFDSRYQVAGSIIEDYQKEKKLVIKYSRINLDDMDFGQLAGFIASYPLDYKPLSDNEKKTEKLWHQCVGGTNDSKTLVLDRPTGLGSAANYGRKVADFAAECLDGGGCVEVCIAPSSISANEESLIFHNDSDKIEYIEMVDRSINILHQKLENFKVQL